MDATISADLKQDNSRITTLLMLACFCVFSGRAFQAFFWDLPLRTLFWDEALLSGVVQFVTGLTWAEYVRNPLIGDRFVLYVSTFLGIFWSICAFAPFFISKWKKWISILLFIGGFSLIGLSLLYWKDKFYVNAQFWEHSIQFGCPFVLVINNFWGLKKAIFSVKVLTSITFISHGLYAMNIYPISGEWLNWTLNTISSKENEARFFLYRIGQIDIIAALLLWILDLYKIIIHYFASLFEAKSLRKLFYAISFIAILYCTIWGFTTAFMRLFGQMYQLSFSSIFYQYGYQAMFRIPHGLFPLAILSLVVKK